MEEVSTFVNVAQLYIRIKIIEEVAATQVAWVLLYVQGGIVEAWKDNLLDELVKGELEVESVEQLFAKIRNNFGETLEEERKIEQLRTIEQGGIAEAWKDNLLDELAKGESEVESAEQLFAKIRNDFGEMSEEERKIEQLRTIKQGGRTCDEYVQEFKKVTRGSNYEGRPLIEEFK